MGTSEEIVHLRAELERVQNQALKSRRRAAVMIGSLAIIVLLSFVYAYVQQVAATKNAELAWEQKAVAEQSEMIAIQSQAEAQKQRALSEEQRTAAARMVEILNEELAKCRTRKR